MAPSVFSGWNFLDMSQWGDYFQLERTSDPAHNNQCSQVESTLMRWPEGHLLAGDGWGAQILRSYYLSLICVSPMSPCNLHQEINQEVVLYILVFWSWGMWSLNSLTRGWTFAPCSGSQSLNHWAARQSRTNSLVVSEMRFCVLMRCNGFIPLVHMRTSTGLAYIVHCCHVLGLLVSTRPGYEKTL